ncbi:esterase FE4-like [Planococcus citri]|uniref:esterase FE4-like n=1 Tax=Planococcus citri TaxID=170843 RepID=UPI0031F8FB0F
MVDIEDFLVTVPNGKLMGGKATSEYSHTEYFQFCGIPYARPPVGALRFKPPQPIGRWSGILNAKNEKDDCVQYSLFTHDVLGSEDCLYLNVFTLEAPRKVTTPKAVVVQIHQGGHYWGSSSKKCFGNPDFFIDQDIIYVTFNYRLHILGYLNLNLPQCPGNMGMKDQSLALKWVKENIRYFGGDPNNITLYGNSSGASDAHLHMMSPMSKDLFDRVVLQDGFALNSVWSFQESNIDKSFRLARMIGFKGSSTTALLRFLKKQDPRKLVEACIELRKEVQKENAGRSETSMFQPTIEIFEQGAFMSKSPRELIKYAPQKPLICSVTSDEGLVAFYINLIPLLNTQLAKVIRGNLWMYDMNDEMVQYICQQVKSFYFNNKRVDYTMLRQIIDLYTDLWYCEWNEWLNSVSSNPSKTPVYAYYFAYEGSLNLQHNYFVKYLGKQRGEVNTRASHGDDSAYFSLFLTEKNEKPPLKVTDSDREVIHYITHMITNFAKNGNPNGKELGDIQWSPFTDKDPSYLFIDGNLQIVRGRIYEARYKLWNNLIKRIKKGETESENCIENIIKNS